MNLLARYFLFINLKRKPWRIILFFAMIFPLLKHRQFACVFVFYKFKLRLAIGKKMNTGLGGDCMMFNGGIFYIRLRG